MKKKDVDLSKLVTLNTPQVITGYKQFTQPIQADKFIKTGGTDNQLLLANGSTSDIGDFLPKYYPHAMGQLIIEPNNDIRNQIAPLPTPPVENAIKQSLTHGMYESFAWGQFTTYNGRAYISVQVTHNNPNTSSSSTYTLFTVFKDEAKPQFTGTPFNIALNAVMYVTKQSSNPILWTNAVPIDCTIDVNAPTAIT
ncbi:MAG: hypothetical protein EZS28_009291 [Streblomastix strix]|uniref:Uncharacterized protein n=1 Tax=Streblomastix strix TaxID=222440 RepID=A0A5J4WK44_9EUKA|nr:MAG: hypothetical protein EZS28_009291 [Streblomastix strix]